MNLVPLVDGSNTVTQLVQQPCVADVGRPKVVVWADRVRAMNSDRFAGVCTRLLADRATAGRLSGYGRELYQCRYQPERAADCVREAAQMALG